MSKPPFFTWHNILCGAVVGAVGVRACVRACGVFFTPAVLPSHSHVVAVHNNIRYARQHGVRSARLPRFGEMFQWRKSSVCCFGARGAVKRARGTSISLAPPSTSSFALATPTDGSIKFC
jgi:hypothetical protein